ncbi:hypothetical protein AGMMS49982_00290 [Bacteroidia bacterium]|nr:hypothetical protein AGMMS49982_00290 [Bacteroidia bacterium]
MNKVMIFAATAAFAGVMMTGCGSSKVVAQVPVPQQSAPPVPQVTTEDDEVARIEKEARLEEARAKLDAAKRKRQREERIADKVAALEENIEDGAQMILVPCQDEALDKIGEWMGGMGIGEHLVDQQEAVAEATTAAIANLSQKFVGVVKNILQDYGNKTNTPDGNQARQSDLSRGVQVATEKVVDKYSSTVCQKQMKTKRGAYKVYVATRIPIGTYKDEVSKELDVMKVKYDKAKLFESMDAQLAKQAAVDEQKREQLQQLQQQ